MIYVIWKPVCDFLLVINGNLGPILHHLAIVYPTIRNKTNDNYYNSSTITKLRLAKNDTKMVEWSSADCLAMCILSCSFTKVQQLEEISFKNILKSNWLKYLIKEIVEGDMVFEKQVTLVFRQETNVQLIPCKNRTKRTDCPYNLHSWQAKKTNKNKTVGLIKTNWK